MDCLEKYAEFKKQFGGQVKEKESLSAYTTFGTGGLADLLLHASNAGELSRAVRIARELSIPYFVIGEGSNLLISDDGFRGMIIRNSIRERTVENTLLHLGAGENLDRTVDFATECSLTGLEFAAGIWGSIGGAIYGNAGAFGSQISAVLESADLVDAAGEIRTEAMDYFRFAYRHSYLKETREVVVAARFRLAHGDKNAIGRRVDEIREVRRGKHPEKACSAGCFFKNIEDISQPYGKLPAGKLLDEIGAKELSCGGAGVFDAHANIIINKGGATSKDIRSLADTLKKRVKDRFNIELKEEVICLGEF